MNYHGLLGRDEQNNEGFLFYFTHVYSSPRGYIPKPSVAAWNHG